MKIQVICQECGKKITEIEKDVVSNDDINLYEKSCQCEEHGGNTYVYDEETGELLSSTIIIKAFKVSE